jgi:hypothetical protein
MKEYVPYYRMNDMQPQPVWLIFHLGEQAGGGRMEVVASFPANCYNLGINNKN